jgi:tetratricopeptide (TPR) repeat protein
MAKEVLGGLTPYEKRQEYYSVIQLGKDVKTQTSLLKNQTNAMLIAQSACTNAIVASQESIRDGLNDLSYSIEEIRDGMFGLKAAFEFGISEVVWQIEQNRQVLKDILGILMAPLDTQAKELRQRAEDAYANGWYDEALEDFLESEKKNKYDFSVQISIGLIYLFHLIDRALSIEYFEKAIKYARPKSPYHASFALLHAALIKRDFNQFEEAEKLTEEAVVLTPNFAEALYQNALFNAHLKNVGKSIATLEKAINLDRNYCIKADSEEMFSPIRDEVNSLFVKLRDKIKFPFLHNCEIMEKALNELMVFISNNSAIFKDFSKNPISLLPRVSKIQRLLNRNTYFDSINAQPLIESLLKEFNELFNDARTHLVKHFEDKLNNIERAIYRQPFDQEQEAKNRRDKIKSSGGLACLIWAILLISDFYLFVQFFKTSSHQPSFLFAIVSLLIFIFLFGGFFIAKGILRMIVPFIFPIKDYSGFINQSHEDINALKKQEIEICNEFDKIRS